MLSPPHRTVSLIHKRDHYTIFNFKKESPSKCILEAVKDSDEGVLSCFQSRHHHRLSKNWIISTIFYRFDLSMSKVNQDNDIQKMFLIKMVLEPIGNKTLTIGFWLCNSDSLYMDFGYAIQIA